MKKISYIIVFALIISCLCIPSFAMGLNGSSASPREEALMQPDIQREPIGTTFYTTRGTVYVNQIVLIVDGTHNSTGDYVRVVQALLKLYNASYPSANCDPGTVDGIWGVKTDEAVRSFQSYKGLTVDGSVGYYTWASFIFFYDSVYRPTLQVN